MSLQRGCQFCGRRMRGVTPGALTILLDGQPLDAAIVLCAEHGVEIRRVLDMLRQRSTIAQHARALDVTVVNQQAINAPTELFPAIPNAVVVPLQHAPAPVDARLPMPLQRPVEKDPVPRSRHRHNLASLRTIWRDGT